MNGSRSWRVGFVGKDDLRPFRMSLMAKATRISTAAATAGVSVIWGDWRGT